MKRHIGIVRKLDKLGRFTIPSELRRGLHIEKNCRVAFYVDGEELILMKHEHICSLCKGYDSLINFRGKFVCQDCIKTLNKLAGE